MKVGIGKMIRKIAWLLVISALFSPVYGQTTLIQNGGFELGAVDGTLANVANWSANHTYAGEIVTDAGTSRSGSNYLILNAYSNSSHYLQQEISATAGKLYKMDGYMMTPSGADEFNPVNGYTYLVIKFYNGSTKIGSDIASPLFDASSKANSWTYFETPVANAPAGTTAIRASFAYRQGSPADTTTAGVVYFDDLRVIETSMPTSGAIVNPSFDVEPVGTATTTPGWPLNWATDMAVVDEYPRTGDHSLLLWWENQGLGQTWEATEGYRYEVSGYVATPSSSPMGGYATNTFAAILLDYFDVDGNKLSGHTSPWFTSDSPENTWEELTISGVAPVGTVTAKTTCCIVTIVPDDLEYSGKVYFDDVSQRIVSTGSSTSGMLSNPGFEDGATGDAANELPSWNWAGGPLGTNGGFVVDEAADEGAQSLLIVWPNNLAGQDVEADNSMSYIAEGSIRVASDLPITNEAYASVLLEFLTPESGAITQTVSTVSTPAVTSNSLTDTWMHFSVTNRPPYSGPVTARVWCSFLDISSEYTNAAKIYFDNLTLTETNLGTVANTQDGELWNPGFEYTAQGTKLTYIENWEALGEAGNIDGSFARSGDHSLKIFYTETLLAQTWDAVPGEKHTVSGWASTRSGADQFTTISNGTRAALILQYMDDTTNALATYLDWYDSGSTPGSWSNLTATGVAPIGTVTARVMCAVLGADDGFSGSVWFDDISQDFLYSGVTTNGICLNPGFDDNIQGNLYELDEAGELHNWTWLGGTNAGFIVDDPVQAGEQAAIIVWPNNLLAQDFTPTAGMGYVVEGYIMAPSGANSLTDTTAYASMLLQFLPDNPNEMTQAVSTVSSEMLTFESPKDTWIKFSVTNRAPWYPVSTGRVMCAYLDLDTNHIVGGSVLFDSITVTPIDLGPEVNETSGELENPGFEYTALGTTLGAIDDWENLGFDGVIDNSFTRTGDRALKIFYFETLLAQYWDATPGQKHEVQGYAATPSGADQLITEDNTTKAILLLQYLDVTGTNVLATYESDWFSTNDAVNVWKNLRAVGVAPENTVTARVLCALLGEDTNGFGGAVWFDDISHTKIQDGPITTGELVNAGFDDNILGNAYAVNGNDSSSDELPGWTWFGGDNAGFLVDDYSQGGSDQSLVMTWPKNYMVQEFDVQSGHEYKIEGYMFTPSGADKFNSDGTSYGQMSIAFHIDGSSDPHLESLQVSENFTHTLAADTWHYFCITGMAPTVEAGSVITGKLACTIIAENEDPADDWDLAGVIAFDSFSVEDVTPITDPYAEWLTTVFGGTGIPGTEADEDYDGDNFSNWNEFIAGTSPTNGASSLVVESQSQSQGDELVLSWPSVAGRYYRILSAADLDDTFTVLVPNLSATAPLNVYTTSISAVEGYYYRVEVSTNPF